MYYISPVMTRLNMYTFQSGCEQYVFSFRSTDTNVLNRPDEADLFNLSFARSPRSIYNLFNVTTINSKICYCYSVKCLKIKSNCIKYKLYTLAINVFKKID